MRVSHLDYFFEPTLSIGEFFATFSVWISSFMVPHSPYSGSASMLCVLATFYYSALIVKHHVSSVASLAQLVSLSVVLPAEPVSIWMYVEATSSY